MNLQLQSQELHTNKQRLISISAQGPSNELPMSRGRPTSELFERKIIGPILGTSQ